MATVTPTLKVFSLDGKAMRAGAKASDSELHILTLINAVTGVVRAQIPVPQKTNEIPVAQELLASLPLDANTIVIADALHTQTKTAEVIILCTQKTAPSTWLWLEISPSAFLISYISSPCLTPSQYLLPRLLISSVLSNFPVN